MSYVTEGWSQFAYPMRAYLSECQRNLKHDTEYPHTPNLPLTEFFYYFFIILILKLIFH